MVLDEGGGTVISTSAAARGGVYKRLRRGADHCERWYRGENDPCFSLLPAQQCPRAKGNHEARLVQRLPIISPGLKGADIELLFGALGASFLEGGTSPVSEKCIYTSKSVHIIITSVARSVFL